MIAHHHPFRTITINHNSAHIYTGCNRTQIKDFHSPLLFFTDNTEGALELVTQRLLSLSNANPPIPIQPPPYVEISSELFSSVK